jgi:hypothetical protein
VRPGLWCLLGGAVLAVAHLALTQDQGLSLPKSVEAGNSFSIQSAGNGPATLYIIGPEQVLKRDLKLGETTQFSAGSLYNAGHYIVILAQASGAETGSFDMTPASAPASLSFLAKPSRLPINQHDGITGATYVFDAYDNLISAPTPIGFELTSPLGTVQKNLVTTRDGAAWTQMNSTAQQGSDKFVARTGEVLSARVIRQVPGDPCGLKMRAQASGQQLELQTDQVRDCSGNAVPDGTIVTFTETYADGQSTVDVPLKHDVAEVRMPAHSGATFSVASGVVLGNQIAWGK